MTLRPGMKPWWHSAGRGDPPCLQVQIYVPQCARAPLAADCSSAGNTQSKPGATHGIIDSRTGSTAHADPFGGFRSRTVDQSYASRAAAQHRLRSHRSVGLTPFARERKAVVERAAAQMSCSCKRRRQAAAKGWDQSGACIRSPTDEHIDSFRARRNASMHMVALCSASSPSYEQDLFICHRIPVDAHTQTLRLRCTRRYKDSLPPVITRPS